VCFIVLVFPLTFLSFVFDFLVGVSSRTFLFDAVGFDADHARRGKLVARSDHD
jgi:hypothetical protein